MGVTVALVIFVMLSLTLLLTTMLMYTKKEQAREQAEAADAAMQAYVKPAERELEAIKRLAAAADQNRQSVVTYQQQQFSNLMARVTGNGNATLADFNAQFAGQGLQESENVLGMVRNLKVALDAAQQQAATMQEELTIARAQAEAESQSRIQLQERHASTIASLNEQINQVRADADRYKALVDTAEGDMRSRVETIREQYEQQIADLNSRLEDATTSLAQLRDDNRALHERIQDALGSGITEDAQIDGTVVQLLNNDEVFIDLGRNDHILLGMTFDVYSSVSELRPDARGFVNPGKATVEVTSVGDASSTARVVRSSVGQAVVVGDLLVNPVYDPNKKYAFFVFGQFDLDGEDGPTDTETEMVKARIREWGGEIRDEFDGDIDFLVLGQQPQQPLPLPDRAPPAVVTDWLNRTRAYNTYMEHLERARSLSIPVVNQNRLLTLIGYYSR